MEIISMITWKSTPYAGLSRDELYAILALRQRVFAVEQQSPYLDADGLDAFCEHLTGCTRDGAPCAYLRIVPPGVKYGEPSIGRILTFGEARGVGIGRELVRRGMARAGELYPGLALRISAQHRLERFYESFGFVTVSEPYDEDGIPHVEMVCAPQPPTGRRCGPACG